MNMHSSTGRRAQVPPARVFRTAILAIVLMLPLSACGPSEPQQRQAFIDFLKVRLLEKPGIRLPVPSDQERKAWGPYATHYAVIADGYHALDGAARTVYTEFNALNRGVVMIGALMDKRSDVERLRDATKAFADTIGQRLEAAKAARAALPPQPADLRPVFDAAFERSVSRLAAIWTEATPAIQRTLNSYLDLIDFIARHKGSVKVSGAMIAPEDQKLVPRLTELMNAVRDSVAASNAQISKGNEAITKGQ
jgi:hypothetical protein